MLCISYPFPSPRVDMYRQSSILNMIALRIPFYATSEQILSIRPAEPCTLVRFGISPFPNHYSCVKACQCILTDEIMHLYRYPIDLQSITEAAKLSINFVFNRSDAFSLTAISSNHKKIKEYTFH